jgi:hypothetical protein
MLISDRQEFIFLRVRKVASTSMRDILRPICNPVPKGRLAHLKSRARLEWDYHHYRFRAHDDIIAAQRRMPESLFNRYFKFAFVRNTWARLVSEYEFLLERSKHGRHKRVSKLDSFKDFIHLQIPRRDAYQSNMLCDKNGKLLMDFVGKLETLDKDWQFVCERIGIPHQLLPVKNETQHRRYQDYFDSDSIDLVRKHWSHDIELFGYSFENAD